MITISIEGMYLHGVQLERGEEGRSYIRANDNIIGSIDFNLNTLRYAGKGEMKNYYLVKK